MNMYQQKVDLEEQEMLLKVCKEANRVNLEQVDKLEEEALEELTEIQVIHTSQDPEVLERHILEEPEVEEPV